MKTLTLSEAKSGDSEAIASFYKELDSTFIVHPPSEKQREAIELGIFFVLKEQSGKIVGATSMIVTGRPELVELANSGILEEFQGLGLQQVFLMVRAASAAALFDQVPQLVTAVSPHNPRSRKNVLRAGFEAAPELMWDCGGCEWLAEAQNSGRLCCCDTYSLSPARHRLLCRELLEAESDGSVWLSNGRRDIHIVLDCAILREPQLREAVGSFLDGRTLSYAEF